MDVNCFVANSLVSGKLKKGFLFPFHSIVVEQQIWLEILLMEFQLGWVTTKTYLFGN